MSALPIKGNCKISKSIIGGTIFFKVSDLKSSTLVLNKTKEILTFLTEHHKSRKCQQVFQKRGQLPSITRAFSTVYFCCDRISSLPNCSGKFLYLRNDIKISSQISVYEKCIVQGKSAADHSLDLGVIY